MINGNIVAHVLINIIAIFTFSKVSLAQNQAGTQPKALKKAEELTSSTDMITGNIVAHALLIVIVIFTFSNISSAQNQAGTKPEASKQAEKLTSKAYSPVIRIASHQPRSRSYFQRSARP